MNKQEYLIPTYSYFKTKRTSFLSKSGPTCDFSLILAVNMPILVDNDDQIEIVLILIVKLQSQALRLKDLPPITLKWIVKQYVETRMLVDA